MAASSSAARSVSARWATGRRSAWVDTVIPTTDPETTTDLAIDWFREVESSSGSFVSLGVASFGPLDLEAGTIARETPKTAWRGWPLRSKFEDALGVPVRA